MSLPRYSVNNPVFVNMIVLVTLIAGAVFAMTLIREMFPESRPNRISIDATFPATQPDELERAVTIKVEEAVRDVNGVERVDSTVSEGRSLTILTLFNNIKDVDVVLQEVKNEVDALQDLPDDLEKITVAKIEPTLPVIMVSVFGDGDEAALKRAARDIKDDLLELPGISNVQLTGLRDDEISVEIRPELLFEYDITFDEVAQAIRQTNLDVSAGRLKGDRSQVSVRMLGEQREARDLGDIEVRALPDGRVIRLKDVADIKDQFVDVDVKSYYSGKRSANLIVEKTPAQDAVQISSLVKAYVAGKRNLPFDPYGLDQPGAGLLTRLGAGLSQLANRMAGRPDPLKIYEESRARPFRHQFQVDTHTDLARFVSGRLDLMIRNGKSGLLLVLLCLILFLNWRVALWTAVGLPVSFLGTFVIMALMGVTVNLLSMFGLIIVLGIIVDDAIVIGENIYRRVEEGLPARVAAIEGANEVLWPVVVSVSTTVAAFMPLMFIRGQIGDFMRQLPLVVVAALSVSLTEALLVLPAHLRHLPPHHRHVTHKAPKTWLGRLGHRLLELQHLMMTSLMSLYGRLLRLTLEWRYVSLALAVSACIMSFGLLFGKTPHGYTIGNIVNWEFVQKMDAESMYAQIEMPVGTNAEAVEERLRYLGNIAQQFPEVQSVSMDVAVIINVGAAGETGGNQQSHLGQLWVELLPADEREAKGLSSSQVILAELRKASEQITGVNSIIWEVMNGGPGGRDIEIRLSGTDLDEIRQVSDEFKQYLATFDGVVDLDDNFDEGKRELQLTLRESARPTGMTRANLGNFVRAATYGAEARRITRNREDVKIMVRYPERFREDVYNIEAMWVPTPIENGTRGWVPLRELAVVNETRGYTQIHRSQQKRAITVWGEVDPAVTSSSDILSKVRADFAPQIQQNHPGVKVEFLGSADEAAKAFGSLTIAFPVAMLLIYMMIAGLFRSYAQPLVVMAAIPFGFMGAIIGHWLTGNPMTILSMIGLVALSGIVVNDAIVLIDFINVRVRQGGSEFQASLEGSILRLRPILLTSVTTIAGLTPLMFEKSFQAKFLIPMAVTLTFGLAFATVLTLLIVPVLNMIFFDLRNAWRWLWTGEYFPPAPQLLTESSEPVHA